MAIQTKAQLSASNNTAFPDNTQGDITPEILRNYNTASIDSLAFLSGSNTFVGNQIVTGSLTVTQTITGSIASASYASASTSASYALNATNAVSATSASYALNATNANLATSASYASSSTSASYALVAESANTIGSTTVNGVQTYAYSQTLNTGGNLNCKETKKFVTGSFNCISGSWTKFMNISHSTANWRGSATFTGTNMTANEFGMNQTNFVLRASDTSIVSSDNNQSATNGLAVPQVSASWNGSSMDIYGRSSYNLTGSLLVDMVINLTVTGSTITFF